MEDAMAGKFLISGSALALMFFAGGARATDLLPNPTLDGGIGLANVTISVSDLERSTKFYQALGFAAGDRHEVPGALAAKTLGTPPDDKLEVRFISRNGMLIELVHIIPSSTKPASPGAAGQLGLSNFAFRVDDVMRVAALIKANGGTANDSSHATMGEGPQATEFVFCGDPDGVRLELVGPAKK